MNKSQKSKVKGQKWNSGSACAPSLKLWHVGDRQAGRACRQAGFTLIELLIVITIIGILSSLMVVNYIGVRARARDAQRKADLRQIQSALELYRSDAGNYPAALLACGSQLAFNGTVYMNKIPCDPTNNAPLIYVYKSALGGTAYTLGACLENVNDNQKDTAPPFSSVPNPSQVDSNPSITNCAGGSLNWSYTLYSP